MLNIPLFIATFSSVFWVFFSFKQLNLSIFNANITPEQLYQAVFVIALPLAIIWGIVALLKNNNNNRDFFRYLYLLADQIKKNTESTVNLEQALLSSAQNIKNGVTLQEFNALIADTNEILSDIIKRSNSISSAQIEHLWSRTSGGERWLLAKTFIEISNYQAGFTSHLEKKANKDILLKGSILEFIARYKTLHNLLEQQDSKKIFYNMIEYGALGKVSEILTPIAASLSATKTQKQPEEKPISEQQAPTFALAEETLSFPSFLSGKEDEPTAEQPTENNNIDEGLRAIREEILTPNTDKEPSSSPSTPIISAFSQTESALRSIHTTTNNNTPLRSKEEAPKAPVISLDELEKEINASPENNYDEYAYPFGAWLNEKNNK